MKRPRTGWPPEYLALRRRQGMTRAWSSAGDGPYRGELETLLEGDSHLHRVPTGRGG